MTLVAIQVFISNSQHGPDEVFMNAHVFVYHTIVCMY